MCLPHCRTTGLCGCSSFPPSFASLSAASFPGIPTCAGIHWNTTLFFWDRILLLSPIIPIQSFIEATENGQETLIFYKQILSFWIHISVEQYRYRIKCLAEGHNPLPRMRFEPRTLRSQVLDSTDWANGAQNRSWIIYIYTVLVFEFIFVFFYYLWCF